MQTKIKLFPAEHGMIVQAMDYSSQRLQGFLKALFDRTYSKVEQQGTMMFLSDTEMKDVEVALRKYGWHLYERFDRPNADIYFALAQSLKEKRVQTKEKAVAATTA